MLPNVTGVDALAVKLRDRRWIVAATVLSLLGAGFSYTQLQPTAATHQPGVTLPERRTVTALGRLQPRGEVIKLSAPTTNQGNRVDQLLVREGDRVRAGQVIAILDNRDRLQAAYDQAQQAVKLAQAKLDMTRAGAKQGEIAAQAAEITRLEVQRQGEVDAQAATVARLESELQNARTEYNRYQTLFQDGAVSASQRDSKRLVLETAEKTLQEARVVANRIRATRPAELEQARATLNRIAEVRPVDVAVSQAEVDRAVAAMNQAKAELEQAFVRSPIDGEILFIQTRAGEVVGSDGIVEIGQTGQMQTLAEVYQSDVDRVRVGQRVRVSSDSLPGELTGTVERIGSQVRRQTIINTDPSSNIDARVVEVWVALDNASSLKAAKMTNLQVKVVVEQ